MPDLIITEALGSAIQQHADDIERYRLLIARRAQHEGPQAILSLVYGWHVAAGIVQALRQVRDTDRTARVGRVEHRAQHAAAEPPFRRAGAAQHRHALPEAQAREVCF